MLKPHCIRGALQNRSRTTILAAKLPEHVRIGESFWHASMGPLILPLQPHREAQLPASGTLLILGGSAHS